jgi:putative phage-type endonuclease
MPLIELIQGSELWKQWRTSRITATDVPIILGSSPFKTKLELYEEKLGMRPPQPLNASMARGQELEPAARKLASELMDIDFRPAVIECTKYPWLAASLDGLGWCKNQYILEIKCTGMEKHIEAISGIMPDYYADQVQTQLLVTEAEICYYFSYRPEYTEKPYAIIEVYPNLEKQAEIIAKGQEFYINMCTMNPPTDWKLKERK